LAQQTNQVGIQLGWRVGITGRPGREHLPGYHIFQKRLIPAQRLQGCSN
jgi:hypothetical protein